VYIEKTVAIVVVIAAALVAIMYTVDRYNPADEAPKPAEATDTAD
jgi:hypothetical protein